jgi:hypothetical protein
VHFRLPRLIAQLFLFPHRGHFCKCAMPPFSHILVAILGLYPNILFCITSCILVLQSALVLDSGWALRIPYQSFYLATIGSGFEIFRAGTPFVFIKSINIIANSNYDCCQYNNVNDMAVFHYL